MKYRSILNVLLFLLFWHVCPVFAQSPPISRDDLKNVVITMKQEASRGWGGGVNSPYTIMISGAGTITFDGMDDGQAISKYEPPVKVTRRYQISEKQLKELVDEFYKIDFFALEPNYCCRANGDGTMTIIKDGGLATVITSITINGQTKTVTNINFAPEKLIELQRKIYTIGNVGRFVKFSPYWLSRFPDEIFPPRRPSEPLPEEKPGIMLKIVYRKIPRSSPKDGRQIDLNKKWSFITPCLTTKAGVEKLLGAPLISDAVPSLLTYSLKTEKIRVFYSSEKTNREVCGGQPDTVILFSVIPIKDLKLSELKIDPAKFKKDERVTGREMTYRNLEDGVFIETEIVEFSDRKLVEMVTSIQFSKRNSQK